MSQRSWSDSSGFPEPPDEQDGLAPEPSWHAKAKRQRALVRRSLQAADRLGARRTLMSFKTPLFSDTTASDSSAKAVSESQAIVLLQGHNLRMYK
eukprot:5456747-Pyramimonas_sp.AAC.1